MINIPNYTASCKFCKKVFRYLSTISKRNEPVECECGSLAKRDVEAELAPRGTRHKWITENERWSRSMGVPPASLAEYRKRFPNSVYNDKGLLLIKNRKDKLRQIKERDMCELS